MNPDVAKRWQAAKLLGRLFGARGGDIAGRFVVCFREWVRRSYGEFYVVGVACGLVGTDRAMVCFGRSHGTLEHVPCAVFPCCTVLFLLGAPARTQASRLHFTAILHTTARI